MLKKLSQEQIELQYKIRDKWINLSLNGPKLEYSQELRDGINWMFKKAKLKEIPQELKPSNHNIVGIGESTHKHKINGQCVVYDLEKPITYQVDGRNVLVDQFVEVLEPCIIQHEEHKEIPIEVGKYAILPEREVDILEQKIRSVVD